MINPVISYYLSRIIRASGFRGASVLHPVTSNFRSAFPDLTQGQVLRLTVAHSLAMRQMGKDLTYVSHLKKSELTRFCLERVEIAGLSNLRAVAADPKPVIFISPHYGAVSLGCLRLILELSGHKQVTICSSPPGVESSRSTLIQLIQVLDHPVNMVNNDASGALGALKALKKGGALGILPDMFNHGSKRVVFVPFFGRLAMAMSGTASLALKANASIVPFYCYRQDGRGFRLRIDPPLSWARTNDEETDAFTITAMIFEQFEKQFRVLPEYWIYWIAFHRLFEHTAGWKLPVETDRLNARLAALSNRMPGNRPELSEMLNAVLHGKTETMPVTAG